MTHKRVDLITFHCDECRALGGGSRVVDYAGNMLRVMLPQSWQLQVDRMPGNVTIVSFFCPKCRTQQQGGSHA